MCYSLFPSWVNGKWNTDVQSSGKFFTEKNPSAFETSFTFPTIKVHCTLSLSKPCQQSDLPLPVAESWMCLWTKQELEEEHHKTTSFPLPHPLGSPLSASIFIYPFCDADLAACRPPQSAGSFGALRNDSTLSLSDLPACWLQLLLTNSQAESAPKSCLFFLASFLLPGFTLPHIAPSVSVLFMPHLPFSPCLHFSLSPALTKSPPGQRTGARQER